MREDIEKEIKVLEDLIIRTQESICYLRRELETRVYDTWGARDLTEMVIHLNKGLCNGCEIAISGLRGILTKHGGHT